MFLKKYELANRSRRIQEQKTASSLGDLLKELVVEIGIDDKLYEVEALQAWDSAVGPSLAKQAKPIRIKRGVLEVAVPSAVWRSQISFVRTEIISRINAQVGKKLVKDIRLINRQYT